MADGFHIDPFPKMGRVRQWAVRCRRRPDEVCWYALDCANYDPVRENDQRPPVQPTCADSEEP